MMLRAGGFGGCSATHVQARSVGHACRFRNQQQDPPRARVKGVGRARRSDKISRSRCSRSRNCGTPSAVHFKFSLV